MIVVQLLYCKDFGNENDKCVVLDLRLFYEQVSIMLKKCNSQFVINMIGLWHLISLCDLCNHLAF